MSISIKKLNNFSLLTISLIFVFVSAYFVSFDNTIVALGGKVVIYGLNFFLLIFLIHFSRYVRISDKYFLAWFLLVTWVLFRSINWHGILLAAQSCFLVLCVVSYQSFARMREKDILIALEVSGIIFIIVSLVNIFVVPVFQNSNSWGAYSLFYAMFYFSRGRKINIGFYLTVLFLVISGTRSALLALVISIALYYYFCGENKFKFFMLALVSLLVYLVFAYNLFDYIASDDFSQWLLDTTGKRAESGRIELWTAILGSMSLSEWILGFGGGFDVGHIINSDLSPHSNYVYIVSSYGLIGLSLFLLVVWVLLSRLKRKRCFFSFCAVAAFLIRDFFETSLLHNYFPIALLIWAVCATGIFDENQRLH